VIDMGNGGLLASLASLRADGRANRWGPALATPHIEPPFFRPAGDLVRRPALLNIEETRLPAHLLSSGLRRRPSESVSNRTGQKVFVGVYLAPP
jgi:hypothetical protein